MKARQSFRKGVAFLLTLALVLGTFGLAGWGNGEAYAAEDISVTVSIENDTYSTESGAAWEGTLYTSSVVVPEGSTMLDAIIQSLSNEGYLDTSLISGGYISSINGVAAGETGVYAGWLGALNGVFPNVGLGSAYLNNGDSIRLMYSLPSGYSSDSTVSWGISDASSTGFSFNQGIWSSESNGWGGYAITLTVPDSLDQIIVNEAAGSSSSALRIYKYDSQSYSPDQKTLYRIGEEIPLVGLGTNFDSLLVYLNDGATETCKIDIRKTGDFSAGELLSGTVVTLAEEAASNYWNMIGVNAYNLSHTPVSLSAGQIDQFVWKAITDFETSGVSGTTLAMDIIALTSLGYDASNIVSGETTLNGYSIMKDRIVLDPAAYGGWVEIYAYGLMAYLQSGNSTYDSEINAAIANLEAMETNGWEAAYGSADSVGIAVAALSMAAEKGYIVNTAVINSGIDLLKNAVGMNGSVVDSFYLKENANSTAMTILGLDAAGVDVSAFSIDGGVTLLNGLKLFADKNLEGFIFQNGGSHNAAASQQGFLALLAHDTAGSTNIFDFSGNGLSTTAIAYENCPVYFVVMPSGVEVTVKDKNESVQTERFDGIYDLSEGIYQYTASRSGFASKSGSFTVSAEDAAYNTSKIIRASLVSIPETGEQIAVNVYVKTHDKSECDNTYTYKNNSSEYTNLVRETLTLDKNSTVFDALDAALAAAGKTYNESGYGYIEEIDGISEFSHGENSGWLYKVNGEVTSVNSRDYKLTKNSTVVWWFTDDYINDDGSESWSGSVAVPTASGAAIVVEYSPSTNSDGLAKVSISKSELEGLADAGSAIRITSSLATIEMDAKTVLGLSETAGAGLDITASKVDLDSLANISDNVKDQIGDRPVIDLSVTSAGKTISQFAGEVTVKVPYTLATGENSNAIIMYLLNDKGELEIVKGSSYDAETKTAEFITDHFSVYAVGYNCKGFTDIAGNWAADYIDYLAAREIVSGMTETTFAPGVNITRGQFVQLLANMSEADMTSFGALSTSAFKDVNAKAWYAPAVAWAAQQGVVVGSENADGTWSFNPNGYVTRQDVAAMLLRYMSEVQGVEVTGKNTAIAFEDQAHIADYAKEAVDKMSTVGVINGKTSTTFAPSDNATRSEAAKMIFMMLNLK